jgi:peptidoglycan/LPS O-acetylase OafA/YrhL
LEQTGGRPTGFDYLRIILACAVVITHSVPTSYGNYVADKFYWLPGVHAVSLLILPMFFALSGFLVAGSLSRSRSIVGFLGLRFIRIYPALGVEVLLSALILGPLFTTVALPSYFSDPIFWRYMLNVSGDVSFKLPGVFVDNPVPALVNQQLWTVPYELYCYIALSLISLAGLYRRHRAFLRVLIVGQLALMCYSFLSRPDIILTGEFARHVQGIQLVFSFLAGVLVFMFRDTLPWSRKTLLVAGGFCLILFSIGPGEYLGIFAAAYLVVGLGLLNPPKIGVMRTADYSYGVFLYGWPIQQALVAHADWARSTIINSVVTLLLAFGMAAASWHLVERPSLQLRMPLKRLEDRWIVFRSRYSGLVGRARMPNQVFKAATD